MTTEPHEVPSLCREVVIRRKQLQVTQVELADAANIPVKRYALWERGREQFGASEEMSIAAALVAFEAAPRTDLSSLANQIAAVNNWSIDECCERSGIAHSTWHRVVVRRASRPTPNTRDKLKGFVEAYG